MGLSECVVPFLIQELPKVTTELAAFLGKSLTPEQVANIVHHCHFDSMKEMENVNHTAVSRAGWMNFDVSPFMRVGECPQLTPAYTLSISWCILSKMHNIHDRNKNFWAQKDHHFQI